MFIVGTIVLLVVLIVFWQSPHSNTTDVTHDMWEMALAGIKKEQPSACPKPSRKSSSLIYVQLDSHNQLITQSTSATKIEPSLLDELINKALSSSENSGQILLETGETYPYVKVAYNPNAEVTLVFRDLHKVKIEFIDLIFDLAAIFFICVLLVFLGSLYLSSKALVPIRSAWQKQLDFSADASHELRTPIAAIQTNAELIFSNSEETVASQEKWLFNILKENKRMARLVEDLLVLSRFDSGQSLLVKAPLLLDQVIKDALQPLEPLAAERQIELHLDLSPEIHFVGDTNRIKQLVIILVDNAIKYMNRPGSIEVTLTQIRHMVELVVADNGEGITLEALPHLFDRFYRVDKARSRNKGGAGLGLSIAKCITEEHGGCITAESMLGKGTRFIIKLPLN